MYILFIWLTKVENVIVGLFWRGYTLYSQTSQQPPPWGRQKVAVMGR